MYHYQKGSLLGEPTSAPTFKHSIFLIWGRLFPEILMVGEDERSGKKSWLVKLSHMLSIIFLIYHPHGTEQEYTNHGIT